MKKAIIFLIGVMICCTKSQAINYTWVGTTVNWTHATNWSPAGVPSGADSVTIINATAHPHLEMATTVAQLAINSGTLDLNGFVFTITGTAHYTGGSVNNGTVTSTGGTTLFAGTVFGAVVNATSNTLSLNGSTFHSLVNLTKNGATAVSCTGGNIFHVATIITNSGGASLMLASTSPDVFNSDVTFVNTGSASLYPAFNSAGNHFHGTVTFSNTGVGSSILSNYGASATAVYHSNIVLHNTSTGIYFGSLGGTASLENSKTISISGAGFTTGTLSMCFFTQLGTTAQSLSLTGSALLQIGPSTTFDGNVNLSSPQVILNGGTFNGITYIEKKGATDNVSTGGNLFHNITTIANSGSGSFDLGSSNPEYFGANLTVNNTGSSRVQIGVNSVGNLFNGNVTINHAGNTAALNTIIARSAGCTATINGNLTLNCTNVNTTSGIIIANDASVTVNGNIAVSCTSGRGVLFGAASGSVTLANGFTIADKGLGTFTTGTLTLNRFTQLGSTAQNIALTGTAGILLGTGTVFNGAATFSAPQLFLNGTRFNGITSLTKNGATDNTSTGNNMFNATTTIINSGTGFLRLANTTADDFNGDITFVRSGSGNLEPSYNTSSTFSGNVTTNSSLPMIFGTGTGTVVFDGGNAQIINKAGSANPVFNNMKVNKSANDISLNTEISITGSLSFVQHNIISTTANLLVFNDNATHSGAGNSSYVSGPVRKTGNDAFIFPVGKNNFYHPVSITAPALVTDQFISEYFETNPDPMYSVASKDISLDHLSSCEYWALERTNGVSDVTVGLSWNSNSCGVNDLPELRVAYWNGTMWKDNGNGSTTGTTTSGTIVGSAIVTTFSRFTLGSGNSNNPLPIELLHFSAQAGEETVNILWSTASETDNDYYVVEKSKDGINFEPVSMHKGAGNSTSLLHYSTTDDAPHEGISYYRLKQIDFNGEFKYYNIVDVEFKNTSDSRFDVFPNPASDQVNLSFMPGKKNDVITVTIGDVNNNSVFSKTIQEEGINTIAIDLPEMNSGVYFVSLAIGQRIHKKKFIVN